MDRNICTAGALPARSRLVAALPDSAPFIAPEALQRATGRPFRLRLGANESPWGCSPVALEAGRDLARCMNLYCDPESYELRRLLGVRFGCGAEDIVIGEGIDGLLGLAVRAFTNPGDSVVTTDGSYATFAYHARGYDAHLQAVPYRDCRPDLEALLAAARSSSARLIYLANPDNPSGTWFGCEAIEDFARRIPPGCLLLLDEAYGDFLPEGELARLDWRQLPVMRLRTFSKAYGLAGLRVGYGFAHPHIVADFNKVRLHFGISLASQLVCAAALHDSAFVAGVVSEVSAGREDYYRLAASLGMAALPSATNFVTIDAGSAQRSLRWVERLAQEDVFIRRPGHGQLSGHIRISIGTKAERTLLADIMTHLHQREFS